MVRESYDEILLELRVDVATIKQDVEYIKDNISKLNHRLECNYVYKSEFEPVKKIVYGMIGVILTAVAVATASLVIN